MPAYLPLPSCFSHEHFSHLPHCFLSHPYMPALSLPLLPIFFLFASPASLPLSLTLPTISAGGHCLCNCLTWHACSLPLKQACTCLHSVLQWVILFSEHGVDFSLSNAAITYLSHINTLAPSFAKLCASCTSFALAGWLPSLCLNHALPLYLPFLFVSQSLPCLHCCHITVCCSCHHVPHCLTQLQHTHHAHKHVCCSIIQLPVFLLPLPSSMLRIHSSYSCYSLSKRKA